MMVKTLRKIKKIFFPCDANPQSGETLLSLLVSLGIASILIFQINGVVKNNIANRIHIELRKSKNDAKKMIVQTINCRTFDYSCSDGDSVELRNYDGEILVGAAGSSYGRWTIRATCQTNSPVIRFALVDPADNTKFLKDPKTGIEMNWSVDPVIPADNLCRTVPNPLQFVKGERCDADARLAAGPPVNLTGVHPSAYIAPLAPNVNMCNPDGSDAVKPPCPNGTNEQYSYWDRDGDFGKSGAWVVACR